MRMLRNSGSEFEWLTITVSRMSLMPQMRNAASEVQPIVAHVIFMRRNG